MGRPTSCTEDVTKRVCKSIRLGAPIKTATRSAGISRASFFDWMKRGASGEDPFADFMDRVEEAQAAYFEGLALVVTSHIHASSKRDPKMALRVLTLRDPEHWAPMHRLPLTGDDAPGESPQDASAELFRRLKKAAEG